MRHPVRTAKRQLLRFGSCVLSALLALSSVPVSAVDNGVSPVYDEAYYAMTDYYGNLTEGSVVKSYLTNGYSTLTDYGQYDEVLNLTDGTVPSSAGGMTTFRFDAGTAPSHFYFEGKTTRPFEALPWTLAVSYKLNGVPTRAEELAGKTGVVEINLDAIPNPDAIEYARNNYTLEAMAIFNQDDILSLEAPGAQVQLIGNLRAVLFIGLPGEECHYTIRVGSEDFSFGGLTFMLVPATLSQLEEIAKLSERKDDLEDNYNKLSGSLDSLLDALYSMTGSLNASASGLDKLNEARGIFSGGKGVLYDGTDALREDLSNLSELLDPVEGQIETLSRTISDSKSVLNSMSNTSRDLRDELEDLEDALDRLESTGDLRDVLSACSKLSGSLVSLRNALGVTGSTVKKDTTEAIDNVQGVGSKTIEQLKAAHSAYASDRQTYYTLVLKKQGLEETQAASLAKVAAGAMAAGSVDAATTALKGQLTKLELAYAAAATEDEKAEIKANIIGIKAAIQYLPALEQAYQSKEAMSFQTFCQEVLGQSPADAKQTADLWLLYASGKLETDAAGNTTISGELLQNDPEEGSGSDSGSVSGSGANSGSESVGGSPSGSESPSGGGSGAGSNTNAGNNSGNITGSGSSSSGSSDSGSGSIDSSDNNGQPGNDTSGSQNNASGDSNDTTGDGRTPSAPAEDGENDTNGNEGETGNTGAGSVTTGDNNATTTKGGETGADGGKGETGGSTAATPGESESVGGAAIDLIAGGLDSATKQIKDLQSGLYTTMDNIAKPTGRVIDDLAALCARLSELTSLLNKAEDLTSALSGASGELRSILKDAEELQDLLDEYEPTLQETLKTVSSLSVSANKTIRDTQKLVTDTEALLKAAGTPLDAGTKQSLEALASVLRGAARTMSTAGEIKDAKTSICEIIEDTWDEYTGDVNNLLLMDATAEAVSLTDSRNPAPQSIQVLIRTQEITEPEEDEEEAAAAAAEKTTFWGRIAQMFKDLWAAVTGLFGGKD